MLSEAEKKFKECVVMACEMEHGRVNEEPQEGEHHVFSEEFERKMEDVFRIYRRRKLIDKLKRYGAVAAVLVVVAAGGVLLTSTKSTEATTPGVNVLEWLKDYFSFERGNDSRKNMDIKFTETQIGYIPEGFEKTGETVNNTYVKYEYVNEANDYIIIRVDSVKALVQSDSEGSSKNEGVNLTGYEYTYIYNEEEHAIRLIWMDDLERAYSLIGTLNEEIMIKIMNSIEYEQ